MSKESETQTNIMNMLLLHKNVAWAMVVTSGTFKGLKGGGKYKIGHYMSDEQKRKTGVSDIIGQLRTGKFFCIETKREGEKPSKEQYEYIDMVNKNNGVAGYCDSVEGALSILEEG